MEMFQPQIHAYVVIKDLHYRSNNWSSLLPTYFFCTAGPVTVEEIHKACLVNPLTQFEFWTLL